MPEELQPIVQRIVLKDDAAESAKSEAAINRVRSSLRGLSQDTAATAAPASSAALQYDNLAHAASALGLSTSQVSQLTGETTELAVATTQAAAAEEKLAVAAQKSAQAKASSNNLLASARGVAGAAGGIAATVGGGQAVSAVSSVLGLTAALGPAGAAIGVLTAAVALLQGQAEETAEEIKDFVTRQGGIADLVAGGATSAEIQQRVDRLKAAQGTIQQTLDGLINVRDIIQAAAVDPLVDQEQLWLDMGEMFEYLSQTTGVTITSTSELQGVIDGLTGKSLEYTTATLDLNIAMRDGAFAANDQAAAQEAAAEAAEKNREALRGWLDIAKGEATTVFDVLRQKWQEGIQQLQDLQSTQTDNYFDAITKEIKARENIAAIAEQIATVRSDAEASISDLLQASAEKRIDIEANAAERRDQIVSDSRDNLLKIERDLGRSLLNARRDRDVDAAIRAREQAGDQIDDQAKRDEKAQQQLEKTLAQQERAIQTSQDKQIASILSGEQRKIATLQQSIAVEQAVVQNARYAQEQIALYGSGNLVTIHTQMWQDVNAVAVTWAANTANTVRSILNTGIAFATGNYPASYTGPGLPAVTGTAAMRQIAQQEARNVFAGAFTPTAY